MELNNVFRGWFCEVEGNRYGEQHALSIHNGDRMDNILSAGSASIEMHT